MIGVILVVSLLLRLIGITHGLPFVYEHDELNTVMVALRCGAGDFVPPAYHHGSLTSYLMFFAFVGTYAVQWVLGSWRSGHDVIRQVVEDPTVFYVMGRMLVALLGTWSVWLTYRAGSRLATRTSGLIAAAVVGGSVLQVNLSHLIKEDMIASALLGAAFLFVVKMFQRIERGVGNTWRDYGVLGGGVGLACSAKYYAAAGVAWIPWLLAAERWHPRRAVGGPAERLDVAGAVRGLAATLVGLLLGFGLGSPYAFLHARDFLADVSMLRLSFQQLMPNVDGLSSAQLYVRYLPDSVGWPLMIAAIVGGLAGLRRGWRWRTALVGVFPVVFMGLLLRAGAAFPHFLVPTTPFIALLAALGFQWLSDVAAPRRWAALGVSVLAVASLAPTLLGSIRYDRYALAPDTRALAKAWIEANIPPGTRIAVEGAMAGNILFGPPLEADRPTLEQELREIRDRGGEGRTWRMRLELADASSQPTFSLCKTREFTGADLARCDADIGVIVTDTFDRSWQVFAQDRRPFLQEVERRSHLLKQFDPSPGIRGFPSSWALRYDFSRLSLVGLFNNRVPLATGPRIRIFRLQS